MNDFTQRAIDIFRRQAAHNPLYREFVSLLKCDVDNVSRLEEIPFLPVSFFKTHLIQTGTWQSQRIFTSSGTTATGNSVHLLRFDDDYARNAIAGFEYFYGPVKDYAILALLPSYLERTGSSLVYMVDRFIQQSKHPESGFYLDNTDELLKTLAECRNKNIPTILLGVTFALLDLAEAGSVDLSGVIVMETGGMKGRRKEIIREELHAYLCKQFNVPVIHSEYGMTELLSQGWSLGNGLFHPSPSMRILIRDMYDPLTILPPGKSGCINIIDLANQDTCSFIATDDIGKVYSNHSFDVLGRLDQSDIRGCSLLVQ